MRLNQIIKETVSCVAAHILRSRKSKVLYYHDIHAGTKYTSMSTPASTFLAHLDMIEKQGFRVVDTLRHPEREVMICFDDGYRGIWDNRELFYARNLQPTLFIDNRRIGAPYHLDADEIRELSAHGFRFKGHTWSHKDLTLCTEGELRHELCDSRRELTAVVGHEVKDLCFPMGIYSDHVIQAALDADYEKLYTSDPAPYGALPSPLVGRYLLQFATPRQVKNILLGGMDIFKAYYRRRHYKK